MNHESLREYCISKAFVTESFPFDDVSLVLKVGGKMFALIPLDKSPAIALKCNPELAIDLREQYSCVTPAYHFNKKHWNDVQIDGSVSDKLIKEWIDHSYDLVFKSLPKKMREELK